MLNWLARYAPAGTAILDGDGRATGSVLDVGCGPHGFACAHPDVPFVGLDVEFPDAVAPSMTAIQAPPGSLPFADGAFDTVLSLDAFVADVPGFHARPWPMANGLLAALLAWGDLFEFGREATREFAQHRAEWVRLLEGASFGSSFRGGWVLERAEPAEPRVGLVRLADDAVAALRCLRCGAGHERLDATALRCTGCGARVERTPQDAWRLTAPAAPRTELLLAPQWADPASWLPILNAYIEQAGDEATLYLDAATTAFPLETVVELVQTACTELSGGRPFADVVLLAPGEAAPGGTLVRTTDDVSAALA